VQLIAGIVVRETILLHVMMAGKNIRKYPEASEVREKRLRRTGR
jgi:hypothetical protein